MTMPHLMNCAHDENGWCLDCVEELWSKTQIPPEMLEAATVRYMLNIGYSEQAVKMHRQDNDAAWRDAQRHTRLMLEAAGVPALVAKVAELERELAKARRWAAVSECDGSEWSKGYEAARDWVRGVGMAGSSPDGRK